MTRRQWIGAAAAMLLLAAGCGDQKAADDAGQGARPGGGPPAGRDRPRVALVMKSLANEFFQTMENGAREHQKRNADKYELISNGIKDEQDVSQQINLVEQMIAQKVDALVIAPADSKALVGVCQKAAEAGIPVVNIDNRFDKDVLAQRKASFPFVGPDNREGARRAGEALAKTLKPGDAVAILEGAPNAFNGIQRKLGFQDAMNAASMKIVASQTANWETDRATEVASAMLTAHPELKALLCANDSMALGAVSARRAAGREKQVAIVGFDNISAVRQLVNDGTVLATVDQHGDKLAVFGIEYALASLGKEGPLADKETPVDLITAARLKP